MSELLRRRAITKQPAYKYEEEWRLYRHLGNNAMNPVQKYRVRKGLIFPYAEVEIPVLAIKEIIVGPTANFEMVKKGLDHFLYSKGSIGGFPELHINVKKSQIEYVG